jgi:hypothetical protein
MHLDPDRQYQRRWINFYGSSSLMVENLGIGGGDGAVQEHQNKFPDAGSMYKGRALVSFRLEPEQVMADFWLLISSLKHASARMTSAPGLYSLAGLRILSAHVPPCQPHALSTAVFPIPAAHAYARTIAALYFCYCSPPLSIPAAQGQLYGESDIWAGTLDARR